VTDRHKRTLEIPALSTATGYLRADGIAIARDDGSVSRHSQRLVRLAAARRMRRRTELTSMRIHRALATAVLRGAVAP